MALRRQRSRERRLVGDLPVNSLLTSSRFSKKPIASLNQLP
jgi:hypothetical protein